ncbi:DNA repair protein RecO [Candidatus Roizmanbacteria bacterium]|nr:MAG: DNA repair protein RecO [Candidatus Roizmanbacteria bacterium]
MPTLKKLEGFVLKRKILLDKDLFITIFTKEEGKLALFAKGARKFTSRRAAHLQSGNLITAQVSVSNDRMYLQSTDLISGFLQLRTEKYIDHIYMFLAVIDALLPEGEQEVEIYTILKRFFVKLSKGNNPQSVLHVSLQETLALLGYVHDKMSLPELISIAEETIGYKLPRHVIIS